MIGNVLGVESIPVLPHAGAFTFLSEKQKHKDASGGYIDCIYLEFKTKKCGFIQFITCLSSKC
jgi:hypothetical protein